MSREFRRRLGLQKRIAFTDLMEIGNNVVVDNRTVEEEAKAGPVRRILNAGGGARMGFVNLCWMWLLFEANGGESKKN
jgi:hypothetical protein